MNKRTTARRKPAARHAVDPKRHQRLCTVCSHPEREAIEEAFVHWGDALALDYDHDLTSLTSIYRHAHAMGLYQKRSRNMRYALENIIERSMSATVTADSVIRAIRACSCLKDNGEWVDPPTTHRVIVNVTRGDAHAPIPLLSVPASSSQNLPSNGSEPLELPEGRSPRENEKGRVLGAGEQILIGNEVRIENVATR